MLFAEYRIRNLSLRWSMEMKISYILGLMVGMGLMMQTASMAQTQITEGPELYVVNFTAEWCPNCKVLDPELAMALKELGIDQIKGSDDGATPIVEKSSRDGAITHLPFDLTNPARSEDVFNKVNGTVLAGVYGDYVGVTGLVVMVAADSGEKIDCATRLVNSEAIELSITNALNIVRTIPAGQRETESILCPPANKKVLIQ